MSTKKPISAKVPIKAPAPSTKKPPPGRTVNPLPGTGKPVVNRPAPPVKVTPAPNRKLPTPIAGPAPKPAPPATPPKPASPLEGALTGAQRDAAVALQDLFGSFGLGSLSGTILNYIQQGYSADTIQILLQNTPEYKQRFAANQARISKGLPALSPAEYIATERSYRQVMSAAGLPTGFYDQTSDFQKFLENDMSPTELKGRVDNATEALRQAPADTVNYFKQWYNEGDMVAFALDPTKAAPIVEQRIKAAEAAAVAKTQGVNVNQSTAEQIGAQGTTLDNMRQGFGFVGTEKDTTDKLSQIYSGDNVTQDDLVREVFQGDATVTKKRQGLASKERAAFSGSGAATNSSLTKSDTSGGI